MTITERNPSSSSDKVYTTTLDTASGAVHCDCRGFYMKREGKPRECTHTKRLVAQRGGAAPEHVAPKASDPCPIKPMLASAMTKGQTFDSFRPGVWVLEEKFDGHRVLIRKNGTVRAWSRPGAGKEPLVRDLPAHLTAAVEHLPDGVYDGELVVPGGGSWDVTRLDKRESLRLVLFDAVELLGQDLTRQTYADRRALLAQAVAHHDVRSAGERLITAPEPLPVSDESVQSIWARGGEGAILKRLASPYRSGWRTPDWVKVKRSASVTLTVVGFEAGKNGAHSAVLLRGDDGLETKVKTKDNATLRAIAADPDSFIGRRLVVSYTEKTPSGSLRHGMWDHFAGVGE